MKVRVRVLGVLRLTDGGGDVCLDLQDESTIRDVVIRLMELNHGLRSILWDDAVDSPVPNALIMLNGVEVNNLEGLETLVGEGSEIVVLSVTHGG